MRLSEWRTRAPHKDSMTPKVLAVIVPVMTALGAEDDPSCWVVWGDDPAVRYAILVPTDAGLLQVLARVNVPGEGPRASAKLIRWNRRAAGRARARDGRRPPAPGVPGRELRAARRGRRRRRHGLVRPRAVLARRRTAVHATGLQARGRGEGQHATGGGGYAGNGEVGRGKSARRSRSRRSRARPSLPVASPPARRQRAPASRAPEATRWPPRPRPGGRSIRSGERCAIGPPASWPARSREPGSGWRRTASIASRTGRRSIASTTCRGPIRSS